MRNNKLLEVHNKDTEIKGWFRNLLKRTLRKIRSRKTKYKMAAEKDYMEEMIEH